jgi:hypothetical protein
LFNASSLLIIFDSKFFKTEFAVSKNKELLDSKNLFRDTQLFENPIGAERIKLSNVGIVLISTRRVFITRYYDGKEREEKKNKGQK